MKIQITVEDDRIVDLLSVGLEQGIHYWAEYQYGYQSGTPSPSIRLTPRRFTSITRTPEPNDPPDLPLTWKITAAAQARGLAVMAEKYPRHFGDFMRGDEDADTGDVFVQCATIGEVIFG